METNVPNEKQRVNAYVDSLKSLNNPMSGNLELLKEGLSGKIDYVQQLTDLLARHGYTFGQPDSLKNNVSQRLADLMEKFRANQGAETEPQMVRCTFEYQAVQNGKTETYYDAGEIPYAEIQSGYVEPVQIHELYKQAYKVKYLGPDTGWDGDYFDRYDDDSLVRIGGNSWEEAYDKGRKMNDSGMLNFNEYARWTLEEVDLVKEEQELQKSLQSRLVDKNMEKLWKEFPDGMTIHLPKEDLGWVATVNPEEIDELIGFLHVESDEPSMNYGTLRTEIRLSPMDYRYLDPAGAAERQIVIGGNHLLDNLFIEGVSLRTAQELIKSQGPVNNQDFKNDVQEYLHKGQEQRKDILTVTDPRQRFSEVSVMMMGTNGPHIRCKIDEEQQMAVRISVKDYAAVKSQMTDKIDLAVKYFKDALNMNPEQVQTCEMHR